MTYGWMTKSWLNSTEHRQMKAERSRATAQWTPGQIVEVRPACTCRYKPFPHISHAELRKQTDWGPRW